MEEGVEEFTLAGFDPAGEPTVRRTATGRLWLCLEFVPPSWVPDDNRTGPNGLGVWSDLDWHLARAAGVSVVWEDREWFRIDQPRDDTIARIHQFLLEERQWRDPQAPLRSEPGDPPEPFSFDYALDLGGFAQATFGVGNHAVTIEIFAMRNSLAHLADSVLRLTADKAEDVVVFDTQWGQYHIDFRRVGDIVELMLWQFEEGRGDRSPELGQVVLKGRCLLPEMRNQVIAALERILATHGLAEYREMAVDYDFPLDGLERLRRIGAGGEPRPAT